MIRYFEFSFSSAHFYNQPKWDEKKNKETFGACYDPHGHGHDYRLVAGFEWNEKFDAETVQNKIKEVIKPLDHHHLNHAIAEFKTQVPTTENIALYLSKKITEVIPTPRLRKLNLYETQDLWAEVRFE
jgi:6-pyruvoyltetrahydropterin/6-carboxytetrahydropterin synthase